MTYPSIGRFWNGRRCAVALAAGLALAPVAMRAAAAQPAVILENKTSTGVVESVDTQTRTLLLREADGKLVTLRASKDLRKLPDVHAGDKVAMRYVRTVSAVLADPKSPPPTSDTVQAADEVHGRPNGMIAHYDRMRVKIDAIDLAKHTVTFTGEDHVQRTVVVHIGASRDFIKTLKPGDLVDVTFTDVLALAVQ